MNEVLNFEDFFGFSNSCDYIYDETKFKDNGIVNYTNSFGSLLNSKSDSKNFDPKIFKIFNFANNKTQKEFLGKLYKELLTRLSKKNDFSSKLNAIKNKETLKYIFRRYIIKHVKRSISFDSHSKNIESIGKSLEIKNKELAMGIYMLYVTISENSSGSDSVCNSNIKQKSPTKVAKVLHQFN